MSTVRLVSVSAAVTAIVLVAAWIGDISLERAALLAPVLVVGVGAVAGLAVFWGKVAWEQYRGSSHQLAIGIGAAVLVVAAVVLSLLGVKLPHE